MRRATHSVFIFLFLLLTACTTGRTPAQLVSQVHAASPTAAPTGAVTAAPQASPALILPSGTLQAPNPGAPDVADYAIAVRLDPAAHMLSGKETITYHNATQKAIPDLVFHLYLNAFKSPDTVFMKESGGQLRGDRFIPENNGWIEVKDIHLADGTALKLEPQEDGTLARAALPGPVAPGGQVALEISFEAKLPQVFARTGWAADAKGDPFFLVGQWFPKLGVWTEKGWNAHVFHGNAEFFADFGSYAVAITLPGNYVTGASGLPVGAVKNGDGTQTVSYQAAGVIDFAWVASPNLRTASRKQGSVEIVYFYLPEHEWSKDRELEDAAKSLKYFGEWYGAYPYARLSVVDVPDAGPGAGGMEYPTFVTVGAGPGGSASAPSSGWQDGLLITTAHEIGHQWFQSMIATNEAEEPWLDEGFADYATLRLLIADDGLDRAKLGQPGNPYGYFDRRRSRFLQDPGVPMDEAAWKYNFDDYVIASYAKPDMALLTLESELGEKTMQAIMQAYTQRYRFGHPTTADFQQIATQTSGQDLKWFFDGLVYQNETLNYVAKAISGDQISVERSGELIIPTEILVTFSDGSTQTVPWDGKEPAHTFTFAQKKVKSFEIDPGRKLLVETDWKDNAVTENGQ